MQINFLIAISKRKEKLPHGTQIFTDWDTKKICSISKICERKKTPADCADNADQMQI
jgi:hypothetical protein